MVARKIRIQETNEVASLFDTTVEYSSDALPEWFAAMRSIVEEPEFRNMTIAVGGGVHYLIMPATSEIVAPESLDATSATMMEHENIHKDLQAIDTAIKLLAAGISNMRTELLVVKAHVNTIAEHTGTALTQE